MKVTEARLYLSTSRPRQTAIVQLRTDEGLTGVGEAGMHFGVRGVASIIGELARRLAAMPLRSRWDRLALAGLQGELSLVLRRLTAAATRSGLGGSGEAVTPATAAQWLSEHTHGLPRYRALLGELEGGEVDLAMLTVIVRALGDLARAA